MTDLSCFKAYDIRGKVPDPLSPELAFALGRAVAEHFAARRVVLGYDARLSGPVLHAALAAGLHQAGARVFSLGMCGTEEIYDAAARQDFDAGIMITGSHNPADENGFKLVLRGARPVSGDSGLHDLRDRVAAQLAAGVNLPADEAPVTPVSFRQEYVRRILDYTGAAAQKPLRIVADAGNGCAGLLLRELARTCRTSSSSARWSPTAPSPTGCPIPCCPKSAPPRPGPCANTRPTWASPGTATLTAASSTITKATSSKATIWWACWLPSCCPASPVPGSSTIPASTGTPANSSRRAAASPSWARRAHAFMKERMRAEDAVYGGEMSAHHYFRDFAYCDSGMLPWMLVIAAMQRHGKPLAELVRERMDAWPCSGEINRRVADAPALMRKIRDHYAPAATYEDAIDGVNLEFGNWRFNLRMSNTEPLLRLNVESRADRALLEEKTAELLALIDAGL